MAGTIGTAAMLFECSGVGGVIDPGLVPRPEGVDLGRWLTSFPSFGFLLSVAPDRTEAVLSRFAARGIAASRIGAVEAGHVLRLRDGVDDVTLWDFAREPLIGCGAPCPLSSGEKVPAQRAHEGNVEGLRGPLIRRSAPPSPASGRREA